MYIINFCQVSYLFNVGSLIERRIRTIQILKQPEAFHWTTWTFIDIDTTYGKKIYYGHYRFMTYKQRYMIPHAKGNMLLFSHQMKRNEKDKIKAGKLFQTARKRQWDYYQPSKGILWMIRIV